MIEILSRSYVRTIEIDMPNRRGLELWLVVQFVELMQKFYSTIQVRNGEISADGKNVLELLILAAAWKSRLQIEAVGEDASEAIDAAEDFFKTKKII